MRTHLFANTVSNFTPVTAYLTYDREKATNELQYVLDHTREMEKQEYRKNWITSKIPQFLPVSSP